MPTPFKVDITTLNPSDVTPPVFAPNFPSVVAVIDYAFTIRTQIDEPGNTYFVVLPDNAPAPTSEQVKAGTDASGNVVSAGLSGTVENIAGNTDYQTYITVLTASTSYDVYVVAEDNIPNLQTVATKIDVTTLIAPYIEDFSGCIGVSTFSQVNVSGDQIWACTDFGRASTGVRMNGFANGAAVDNEDWLISPPINLLENAYFTFSSQFTFAGNPLKLMISTNYSGSGSPASATWVDLNAAFPTSEAPANSTSVADWTYTTVDLSAYPNQNVYLAFVYISTAAGASRWTLDEFTVQNGKASFIKPSVASVKNLGYSVFPNATSAKNFNVKAPNLPADMIVTAPTNFEVSKDGTTFGNSITFNPAAASASQMCSFVLNRLLLE